MRAGPARARVRVSVGGRDLREHTQEGAALPTGCVGLRHSRARAFLALDAGFRESAESWKAVLLSLRDRGVKGANMAVGDRALAFWAALAEVYPETRMQRCWVHKTANVLDKLRRRLQADAKSMLHEIWQAETRKSADKAMDRERS